MNTVHGSRPETVLCRAPCYDINPVKLFMYLSLSRYAGLGLYSFLLYTEPSRRLIVRAQNSTILVLPISSPTFLPTGEFTYFVFIFLAYGQHLACPWDRTLSVGPTIHKVEG